MFKCFFGGVTETACVGVRLVHLMDFVLCEEIAVEYFLVGESFCWGDGRGET